MSALMFDNRDTKPVRSRLPEVDYVGKPVHQGATNVSRENHPAFWCSSDPKNLTLEFIDELFTQARRSILVEVAGLFKLLLNCRMVLDGQRRSLAISSS